MIYSLEDEIRFALDPYVDDESFNKLIPFASYKQSIIDELYDDVDNERAEIKRYVISFNSEWLHNINWHLQFYKITGINIYKYYNEFADEYDMTFRHVNQIVYYSSDDFDPDAIKQHYPVNIISTRLEPVFSHIWKHIDLDASIYYAGSSYISNFLSTAPLCDMCVFRSFTDYMFYPKAMSGICFRVEDLDKHISNINNIYNFLYADNNDDTSWTDAFERYYKIYPMLDMDQNAINIQRRYTPEYFEDLNGIEDYARLYHEQLKIIMAGFTNFIKQHVLA